MLPMPEPYASPLSPPMPFGQLLDEAMKRTRRHFREIYPGFAIPLLLLSVTLGVLQALNFQQISGSIESGSLPGSCGMLVTILIGSFLLAVGFLALQVATTDAAAGRPVDLGRAWRFAFRPSVLVTVLLQVVAYVIAFFLCILPLFYVVPLLAFTTVIMAEENRFGFQALGRSAELTRYNPRRQFADTPMVKILGVLVINVLIGMAVGLVVALPFQAPMYLDLFRQAASGDTNAMGSMVKWSWIQLIPQALNSLVTTALYLYTSFSFALLFFDTRNRKEGTDLHAAVDAVFQAPPPPPLPPGGYRP